MTGWLQRMRARADHRRLVAEAAADWQVKQERHFQCVWTDRGETVGTAGWASIVGEENGLGKRRVRILSEPEFWHVKSSSHYAELQLWAARAEPRSIPLPEWAA